MDIFTEAFNRTSISEKGYTEDGPTYRGIDRRFWPSSEIWSFIDKWRNGTLTSKEVDDICDPMVKNFYRENFWNQIRGDELARIDSDIACSVFDFAVNSGTSDAIKALQVSLNRLNRHGTTYQDLIVDGKIGSATMAACRRCLSTTYAGDQKNAKILILVCYFGERYKFLTSLSKHEDYLGWLLRLHVQFRFAHLA